MADIKKEQERDELHRAIWAMADDLRGSVGGWEFKSYVLGTMFYRYISENLTNYINAGEIAAGNTDFDYAKLSDAEAEEAREGLVQEKGFFMLPSELFCNVQARASKDPNLNETLETIFTNIENSAKGSVSEKCFSGLFDDFDVNSNQLGPTVARRNERLVKPRIRIHRIARSFTQVRCCTGENIDIPPFILRQSLGKVDVAFEYTYIGRIDAVVVV